MNTEAAVGAVWRATEGLGPDSPAPGMGNGDGQGEMWPTSFAVLELTPAVSARIEALLLRAVGR